jgi:hypothetical protein
MKSRIDSTIDAPSAQRISKIEDCYNIKLPESYLEFLKSNNGGIPEVNSVEINRYPFVIERFLPISEDPKVCGIGDCDVVIVMSQIEERLTDNPECAGCEIFPIAALFSGDFVCLDYRTDKNAPSVCVWDHEESDFLSPKTHTVSDNFSEFINQISG